MKIYKVEVKQVSKALFRNFDIFVDGKNVGVISIPKPTPETEYSHDDFIAKVFADAYQVARRVIIHSIENDVDVFKAGTAKIDFGNYEIVWAKI